VAVTCSTRFFPGQPPGPSLNGTSAGWLRASPSSHACGATASAKGTSSGARWKYGVTAANVVPGASVVPRQDVAVVLCANARGRLRMGGQQRESAQRHHASGIEGEQPVRDLPTGVDAVLGRSVRDERGEAARLGALQVPFQHPPEPLAPVAVAGNLARVIAEHDPPHDAPPRRGELAPPEPACPGQQRFDFVAGHGGDPNCQRMPLETGCQYPLVEMPARRAHRHRAGWKCASTARCSTVAGVNGDVVRWSTRARSPESSSNAIERPGTRSNNGPSP
jgi:hypothetical protein